MSVSPSDTWVGHRDQSARHHSYKLWKNEKNKQEWERGRWWWWDPIKATAMFLSPSKSTRPSPLRSTSRRISLISLLVTCSPISFFMASRSSVKLIWPSPLESNWTQRQISSHLQHDETNPQHFQCRWVFLICHWMALTPNSNRKVQTKRVNLCLLK